MEINNVIKEKLSILAEPKYQKFSSGLLPGIHNILGVRLPELRKMIGKVICKMHQMTVLKRLCFRE